MRLIHRHDHDHYGPGYTRGLLLAQAAWRGRLQRSFRSTRDSEPTGPILDGQLTGLKASAPDVTERAWRTRACRYRAFVRDRRSSPPAVDHARAANRSVAPRTTAVCGSSWAEAGKGDGEQNSPNSVRMRCSLSHRISSLAQYSGARAPWSFPARKTRWLSRRPPGRSANIDTSTNAAG